jgi:hypothetical protein
MKESYKLEHTLLEILISSKMKQFGLSKAISSLASDRDYLTRSSLSFSD